MGKAEWSSFWGVGNRSMSLQSFIHSIIDSGTSMKHMVGKCWAIVIALESALNWQRKQKYESAHERHCRLSADKKCLSRSMGATDLRPVGL